MSTWHGCASKGCGINLMHIQDSRGEHWSHGVEPIGHDAIPSEDVALGRARVCEDIRRQLEHALEKGDTIDEAWVRDWVDWFGNPRLLTSAEEQNAAYRAAMAGGGAQ